MKLFKRWRNEFVLGLTLLLTGILVVSSALLASDSPQEWSSPPPTKAYDEKTLPSHPAPNWFSAYVTTAPLDSKINKTDESNFPQTTPTLKAVVTPGSTMSVVLTLHAPNVDSPLEDRNEYVDSITFVIPGEAKLDPDNEACEYPGAVTPDTIYEKPLKATQGQVAASMSGSMTVQYQLIKCVVRPLDQAFQLGDPLSNTARLRYTVENVPYADIGREFRQEVEGNSIYGFITDDVMSDKSLKWLDQIPVDLSIEASQPSGFTTLVGVKSRYDTGGNTDTAYSSPSVTSVYISWTYTWLIPLLSIMRDGSLALIGGCLAIWIRHRKAKIRRGLLVCTLLPGIVLIPLPALWLFNFRTGLWSIGIAIFSFFFIMICYPGFKRVQKGWRARKKKASPPFNPIVPYGRGL